MSRSHKTSGLNQIGPKHSGPDDLARFYREQSKPKPQALNQRARQSSTRRKVKVTLADRA